MIKIRWKMIVIRSDLPKKFLGFRFGYKIFWVFGRDIVFGCKNYWVLGLGIKFLGIRYWVWVLPIPNSNPKPKNFRVSMSLLDKNWSNSTHKWVFTFYLCHLHLECSSHNQDFLTIPQLIAFCNESQRDPRLNEIIFPYFPFLIKITIK